MWVTPDGTVYLYPPWEDPPGTVHVDDVVYPLGDGDVLSKLDKHSRAQAETERIKQETELIKEIREEIKDKRERQERAGSLESIAKKYGIDPNRFTL